MFVDAGAAPFDFDKKNELKYFVRTVTAAGEQRIYWEKICRAHWIQHWDDILRLIATIKLKEVTASDLFRRLDSYSQGLSLEE